MIKNIAYIMSVIVYYFLESLLVSLFINAAYKNILYDALFTVNITYFQWVIMIWIVKVLLFDLFKVNINKDIAITNQVMDLEKQV